MPSRLSDRPIDRPLPSSEESEKIVLGAILVNNELVTAARSRLHADDFYNPGHRAIFRAMLSLSEKAKQIASVNLFEELKREGQSELFIGPSVIGVLAHGIPHFRKESDLHEYLRIITEKSRARRLIKLCDRTISRALDEMEDVSSIVDGHKRDIDAVKAADQNGAGQIGLTFAELIACDIPSRQEVLFGLGRGEVGVLNAVTNVGKTTFLRNAAVSAAIGKPFPPLGHFDLPKRIALLDFEDSLAGIRNDLSHMLAAFPEKERVPFATNALLVCEHSDPDGEDLNMSKIGHLALLTENLQNFGPDLIIVDTISSAFQIRDENDNAAVRQQIMRPLRGLAKDVNAALVAVHHVGKARSEDGQAKEASHRGRGASSFADMARLVLNLEKDSVDDSIIVSCPKVKGPRFTDTRFKLNSETRWFEAIGETRQVTAYSTLIEMFADNDKHATADVVDELNGIASERTVKDLLRRAVKSGDLVKVQHGWYQAQNGDSAKVQNV